MKESVKSNPAKDTTRASNKKKIIAFQSFIIQESLHVSCSFTTIPSLSYLSQDGYVDWSQPLIGQVEELGDRYYEWAHQQVDRPIRLFHSDLAEWMTRAYWWMVPLVWCPVILYMVRLSYCHLAAQSELWPKDNFLGKSSSCHSAWW